MLKSQFLRKVFPYSIFGKSTQNNQVGGFWRKLCKLCIQMVYFFLIQTHSYKNFYSQVISQNTSSKPDS